MTDVRLGIIGLGTIGRRHLENVQTGAVANAEVTAVSSFEAVDIDLPTFEAPEALLDSDLVDAVIVATPTNAHIEVAALAVDRGIDVLIEKPLAVTAGRARAFVESVPESLVCGVMLNQRRDRGYGRIKELLDSGDLGHVQRVHWTMTHWYRPQIYFEVSNWRGTWPGEGGGALVNQCIHNLDILQWLVGMPRAVRAAGGFGKYHAIEVEDEINAQLEFADGATGTLIASTGEAPGINQLDIVCDRGTLRFDGADLVLHAASESVARHARTSDEAFGMPDFETTNERYEDDVNQHAEVLQNFVDAITGSGELATPAVEGLSSVELANALIQSAWEETRIEIPLDTKGYEHFLQERVKTGSLREPTATDASVDLDKSFR